MDNKYPTGFQASPGDVVRFRGTLKEVEVGNKFDQECGAWTSIQFVGEPGFYFTHKGYIEPVKTASSDDFATMCVSALSGLPVEVVADPNFRTMLHTLAQYAILGDRIGQEQTGWAIGQMMKRALKT